MAASFIFGNDESLLSEIGENERSDTKWSFCFEWRPPDGKTTEGS